MTSVRTPRLRIVLGFVEMNQKFGPLGSQHGLAMISAVLKRSGFQDVHLAHFTTERQLRRWEEDLTRLQPHLVGFYATAEQFHFIRDLIERVPEGIFTVLGGPHATCHPECIEALPRLDALCVGEGEYPMLELAQALQSGQSPSGIPNLWIRQNGTIQKNPTRPFIQNLDELPFADAGLFDLQKKIDRMGMSQVRMITSRGCPYQCTYCSNRRIRTTQPGVYFRRRNASHVMGELTLLNDTYEFKEVVFDDDLFMMMSEDNLNEFCERYPKEIGKPFVFCGHVDLCTLERLSQLKAAGARRIDLGLESGNEEFRRQLLNRTMTNQKIIEASRLAKKAGLQVKTFNLVGLPDETPDLHMDTVRLNREINPDVATIFTFSPYPGTDLYDYCIKKGYYTPTDRPPEGFVSRRGTLMNMPLFPKEEVERCYRLFGFRVYRTHSIVKAVGHAILQSRHGEFFVEASRPFRPFLRRVIGGF